MGMERVGLVAQVEEQLERELVLGRLPGSGQLGSEQKLACHYGVSRGTVREALRRLAARGLVMQHPGRKARAVALDASLTLENLGLALHDERSAEGRWLLEGFFCLKRQVLVELLADCCARASAADLGLLADACFKLWDAARWESGARCAQLEFDLLRLAARAAARPGHLLLIQSLRRALRGSAARLLLLMGGESLRQWACCAMGALRERDTRALQHTLPALLKACDEQVLGQFAPALQDEPREARPREEARGPGRLAPAAEDTVALGGVPRPYTQALPVEPDREAFRAPAAPGFNPGEPGEKNAGGDEPGSASGNLSDCRTGWDASSAEGRVSSPSLPPPAFADPPEGRCSRVGRPLHDAQGKCPHRRGRRAARFWSVQDLRPRPERPRFFATARVHAAQAPLLLRRHACVD
ncbi:GntR family transcriptional regulator [Corallococcus praedator]|uniref:GntR family transcriptional regulator n=2 Tax=Myxococcaceae TaxID=31 RepID=A0ABX9QLS1_9BACT|nr:MULTISPECIES: GntR family transcriptional regulator [Corallococcus]RKH33061.1 GntR family transcriptional regulator [Corallococcus sp. CA031C]RKI12795.1 GntR family transcriptional regulator [Corallococcus praedator]